jgi:hypothetical protein
VVRSSTASTISGVTRELPGERRSRLPGAVASSAMHTYRSRSTATSTSSSSDPGAASARATPIAPGPRRPRRGPPGRASPSAPDLRTAGRWCRRHPCPSTPAWRRPYRWSPPTCVAAPAHGEPVREARTVRR